MGLNVKYFEQWKRLFEVRKDTVKVKTAKSDPAEYVPSALLAEYPYIVVNSGRLNWVHIDVDLPSGLPNADGETPQLMLKRIAFDPAPYDELNIPFPAFSVLSRRSFHLAWPLFRSLPHVPSARAWNFYRDTRLKLALALGGDFACPSNSVSMKNPFYDGHFATTYPTAPCRLADLLVDRILPPRAAFLEEITYETGQRNLATFRAALEYSSAHPGASYERLLDFIESFQANWAIVGATGIDDNGIYDADDEAGAVYRAMATNAACAVLVADSTKFMQPSLTRFAHWADFDVLHTDTAPPAPLATALQAAGVELVVAPQI